MPEGHVIHRIAREINESFGGRPIRSSSPQGRFAESAALIDGRELTQAFAHGKHMFVQFDQLPESVHIHLGLFGGWSFEPVSPLTRGQIRWRIASDDVMADLRGPTTCALITPDEADQIRARLGADPLRSDADPAQAWKKISRSHRSIASLLLDQSVIAGVGNVYRAEVLFRHRVPPLTPGNRLTAKQWDAIWNDLVDLMRVGADVGRIDTVYPEHEPEAMGREPRKDDHGGEVYVYRRAGAPCLVCDSVILTTKLEGRNLFWCPQCQDTASLG